MIPSCQPSAGPPAPDCSHNDKMPDLLVSVRDVDEASAAMAGGADWIDLKEPLQGALGAVDAEAASQVARLLAGQLPLSAAAGELIDWPTENANRLLTIDGIQWIKVGLSGCGTCEDWQNHWQQAAKTIGLAGKQLVAVLYADWSLADAPAPQQVVAAAQRCGLKYLLIDTFHKSNGTLVEQPLGAELLGWLQAAKHASLSTVVAGGLCRENLAKLPLHEIDMIGVRGGVCSGSRTSKVEPHLVAAFHHSLQLSWATFSASIPCGNQTELPSGRT